MGDPINLILATALVNTRPRKQPALSLSGTLKLIISIIIITLLITPFTMISLALTSFFLLLLLVATVVSNPLPSPNTGIQDEGKQPEAKILVRKQESSVWDGSTRITRSISQTLGVQLKLYSDNNCNGRSLTFRPADYCVSISTSSVRDAVSSAEALGQGACYELYTSKVNCDKRKDFLKVRTGQPIENFDAKFNDKVTHVRQC